MKQIICVCILMSFLDSGFGQIGVNTETPLTLFHVDGAKDNSTSPTASQILNDVSITSEGNLGIGTLTPSVKVDIANTGTGGVYPLRIVDGSTMTAKVLESDVNGVAVWTEQPPSYTKSYRAATYGQTFANRTSTLLTLNENIIIPQNGKYLLTIRWWGYTRRDYPLRNIQSVYVYVRLKNGGANYLDQVEYYLVGTIGDQLSFTTSLYLGDRTAGQEVEILINPTIGGDTNASANPAQPAYHWQLSATTTRPDLMPQVIVYSI